MHLYTICIVSTCIYILFLILLADLTSKENIKIEARAAEKGKFVETLIDISISSLNEMVNSIHQLTSESEIDQLYESVVQFIQANKEEIENISLQNLSVNLQDKIASYAKLQEVNKIKILAKFIEFSVKLRRDYGAIVQCSKGSLLLLLTFSSNKGYDLYKKRLTKWQNRKRNSAAVFISPSPG